MIKAATFNSIWDGNVCISSSCKVDTGTKEVFDIETVENEDDLDMLERQFIVFDDGTEYEVVGASERENDDQFWYC